MLPTQKLKLNGETVAYIHAGDGDPMILVHGFPTSKYLFHKMISLLSSRYSVYAIDLMGFGESVVPLSKSITLSDQAKMIGQFADALNLKPFVFVGHDLGGGIGQIIGIDNPDWVKRMIWINSVVADNFPIGRISALIWAMKIPGVQMILKKTPILKWWGKSRFGLKNGVYNPDVMDDTALEQFIYEPYLNTSNNVDYFFHVVRTQQQNGQLTRKIAPDLGKIQTKTLLLWGENDAFFSPSWFDYIKNAVSGINDYQEIPEAGHFCPLDQPELIANAIMSFCDET